MYITTQPEEPPEPDPGQEASEDRDAEIPARVLAALNFIGLCNKSMGTRFFESEWGDGEYKELELHHAQEGAFRLACQAVGKYFTEN